MQYIPLEIIENQITQIDKNIRELEAQRETLIELRKLAIPMEIENMRTSGIRKVTLTDCIIARVHEAPGLTSRAIARYVAVNYHVGGRDKIKTIQTILGQAVLKKKLRKENHLFYPPHTYGLSETYITANSP